MNFNPRTREGCDLTTIEFESELDLISIHAPARGATVGAFRTIFSGVISIHAPARGATDGYLTSLMQVAISIHAPARGATHFSTSYLRPGKNFNPRTREGCDGPGFGFSVLQLLFQSTHPRGVRPQLLGHLITGLRFQSTHPRGVRLVTHLLVVIKVYFNPRTREGCDIFVVRKYFLIKRFQSTHPRGVRLIVLDKLKVT